MSQQSPLNGSLTLLNQGIQAGSQRAEEIHNSISQRPYKILNRLPVIRRFSRPLEQSQHQLTRHIYTTVRRFSRQLLDHAAALSSEHQALLPASLNAAGTDTPLGASVQSAINGAIGDYLATTDNPLALPMTLHYQQAPLVLNADSLASAIAAPTAKLCILVHGLCCNETAWCAASEQHWGKAHVDYGQLLAEQQGYTPIYVRYNSGLHISDNGAQLNQLLGELTRNYPVDIREITLIGHSMGGLVSRSASEYAQQQNSPWLKELTHIICLGSPHQGAPLEQLAHWSTALLEQFATTRPIASVIRQRSIGIKDLRHGYTQEQDWAEHDQDAMTGNQRRNHPLLPHVNYHFVGSSLTDDLSHPLARLGDNMVPIKSATGQHHAEHLDLSEHSDSYLLGGIPHLGLMNHPRVWEVIKNILVP